MSFSKVVFNKNKEDAKKYKGWYYTKVSDKYYIFSDNSNITYTRFSLKDCKKCINELLEEYDK